MGKVRKRLNSIAAPWSYVSYTLIHIHIDGLVQNCSNSSALAMELQQSCTKLSIQALESIQYEDHLIGILIAKINTHKIILFLAISIPTLLDTFILNRTQYNLISY